VQLLSSFAVKRRFTVGISPTLQQMLSRLDGRIHSLITLPLICAQGLQKLPMQQDKVWRVCGVAEMQVVQQI
jgi:hypothetical protein